MSESDVSFRVGVSEDDNNLISIIVPIEEGVFANFTMTVEQAEHFANAVLGKCAVVKKRMTN